MIKYKNRAYTRCPIPNYDIRGTELWLEKMAMDGYIKGKTVLPENSSVLISRLQKTSATVLMPPKKALSFSAPVMANPTLSK